MKKINKNNDDIALTKVKKIYNDLIRFCNYWCGKIVDFKVTGCNNDKNIYNNPDREAYRVDWGEGNAYYIPGYDEINKLYYLDICGFGWRCTLYCLARKERWLNTSFKNFMHWISINWFESVVSRVGAAAYDIMKIDNKKHYYIKDNEICSIFRG